MVAGIEDKRRVRMESLLGFHKASYKIIEFPITFKMVWEKSQFLETNLNVNTTVKDPLETLRLATLS